MTPQSDQVSRQRELLLPCPFCGEAENIAESGDNGYGAFWCCCDACGASTGEWHVSSQAEANARWNRRAALALPSETPEPVGHLHSNGDFCVEKMPKASVWPVLLYAPSETPVGHQIERDGKESGAVGEGRTVAYEHDFGWETKVSYLAIEDPKRRCYGTRELVYKTHPIDLESRAVYLVATGAVANGRELYERHQGKPPALCDYEKLYPSPAELPPPSARSDPPAMSSSGEVTGPVFLSELSAAGEKSGAVGGEGA